MKNASQKSKENYHKKKKKKKNENQMKKQIKKIIEKFDFLSTTKTGFSFSSNLIQSCLVF